MNDPAGEMKDLSLADLFRIEAEGQLAVLTTGLLALERGDRSQLEALMRAAHSLKGAARIVGLDAAVQIAHAMEDCLVAAQNDAVTPGRGEIDWLLVGVDLLSRISRSRDDGLAAWEAENAAEFAAFLNKGNVLPAPTSPAIDAVAIPERAEGPIEKPDNGPTLPGPNRAVSPGPQGKPAAEEVRKVTTDARALRVSANSLNRLLALAGESLVESRRLRPFAASVGRLKRLHRELAVTLETARTRLAEGLPPERIEEALTEAQRRLADTRDQLATRLTEFDGYDQQSTSLAQRLYAEALAVRMRPFADGVGAFPRMVRDLARELDKEVRLEVVGEDTQVDRDILEKLDAPLGHLLRNAIDHGIETPAERAAAGKATAGKLTLEARHSAGLLLVSVSDDGRGVEPETIRSAVVRKGLVAADQAARLSETELLEFLFLPGFSLKEKVTDISGRGVGLDVVQTMVKGVGGTIRVATQFGEGTRFQLQLPLTLSVVRALLVTIGGEPYAIPLGFIARTLRLDRTEVASTQARQHFAFDGRRVGLVSAHEVLGLPGAAREAELAVVVLGEAGQRHGVVVDEFLGEGELVVQPLDPRLGKVKDIAAGALMADGAPVLIIDVADFLRSVEKLSAGGGLGVVSPAATATAARERKRVLVVDDSLTVRELERKLLEARGYEVEIAVDGMDGWNAVRAGAFDLVITDVDMPRLDGFEFTRLIKQDPKLRGMPVMIVSYKDREEDRRRGLDAGADYYLTKASFHDETMLHAVADLIGGATEERT